MLTEAYVGLGSNLGDREANIRIGVELLGKVGRNVTVSGLYETSPSGFGSQPPFLNAACRIWTRLDAFRLLAELKKIEAAVGRRRSFTNAPRVLDLDLLLFGEAVLESPSLTIPHRRMAERVFVLQPLAEIAPELRHPVLEETVSSLLAGLPETERTVARRRYSLSSGGRKLGIVSSIG